MATSTSASRRVAPWAAATLVLGVLALVVGAVRFDALPDPYPTHFAPGGAADAFGAKSIGNVFLPVVVGLLSAAAIFAVAVVATGKAPRVIRPLAALGCAVGGGISLMSLAQYLAVDAVAPAWAFWGFLAVTVAATAWVVLAAVRTEQEAGPRSEEEGRHWKWGLVYVNPQDPDVFVPKRVGAGVTVNFGRPMGWVVMTLILLPGIGLIAWVATRA